ncbi:hypothetical protein CAC42_444 [Sphaceloma murrayae]|uniref:DNA ligase D 3'-phosphoesterase domain-containing protein n=1 Tax=Sphaceloma murrayae TaxID=2082308 RepID=A0A2K1R3H4_9PEZI|nr:hypothetical protein CAC42_444 [Sphaceloma murrayae]
MADPLRSLKRAISPPPVKKLAPQTRPVNAALAIDPSPAAVEAGRADVRDHLQYWTEELARVRRNDHTKANALAIEAFRDLYARNSNDEGHHFVIHQHDHPVSGVHYDLRLQFSATSSLSWSIPYGVPGNANSIRPNRMAIETRVHNVWNHLIESASHATGSLLIWDTGEYEVVPRPSRKRKSRQTDDELSTGSDTEITSTPRGASLAEPTKLRHAFQDRHIHLRLHGTRLPRNYTIALRLPRQNHRTAQPSAPKRRRRRTSAPKPRPRNPENTDSDTSPSTSTTTSSTSTIQESAAAKDAAAASDDQDRDAAEQASIRSSNAYPGANNDIGSVHQRQWFLSLDRSASGFVQSSSGAEKGRWTRGGFEAFVVRGRDVERSVVTGRRAGDVMDDCGVEGYKGRKMWRAITE